MERNEKDCEKRKKIIMIMKVDEGGIWNRKKVEMKGGE